MSNLVIDVPDHGKYILDSTTHAPDLNLTCRISDPAVSSKNLTPRTTLDNYSSKVLIQHKIQYFVKPKYFCIIVVPATYAMLKKYCIAAIILYSYH